MAYGVHRHMNEERLATGVYRVKTRDLEDEFPRPVERRISEELTNDSERAPVRRMNCVDGIERDIFQRHLRATGDEIGEAEFEVDDVLQRSSDGFVAAADVRRQREDGGVQPDGQLNTASNASEGRTVFDQIRYLLLVT